MIRRSRSTGRSAPARGPSASTTSSSPSPTIRSLNRSWMRAAVGSIRRLASSSVAAFGRDPEGDRGLGRGDADLGHASSGGQVEGLGLDLGFPFAEEVDLAVNDRAGSPGPDARSLGTTCSSNIRFSSLGTPGRQAKDALPDLAWRSRGRSRSGWGSARRPRGTGPGTRLRSDITRFRRANIALMASSDSDLPPRPPRPRRRGPRESGRPALVRALRWS